MRNLLGLQIETKISLIIVVMIAIFFLIIFFKIMREFDKFNDKINQYEELFIEKGE